MSTSRRNKEKTTIGSTEYIEVAGVKHLPAKIDTGADSSSIWASHIRVTKDGILSFRLFDKNSPFYTGKTIKRKDYKVAVIRSSSGHEQIRYRVHLRATIRGRTIRALFTLSDRSGNNYPILIGRRTIAGKFIVDVTLKNAPLKSNNPKTNLVQKQFKKNPYNFHRRYIEQFGGDASIIKTKEEK